MNSNEKVAKILLEIKAVTLSPRKPYRFVSGLLSPIYTDNRLLMSYPKYRREIVKLLADLVRKIGKPDVIAGTATAGVAFAAWLSEELNLPMVYTRIQAKDHGRGKQVEGVLKRDQKVLVIEDLISTGKSGLETLSIIRKNGGKVDDVVSIFSYTLTQSLQNYQKAKAKLYYLVDAPSLLEVAEKEGCIKEKEKNAILEWIKSPVDWEKKRTGFG